MEISQVFLRCGGWSAGIRSLLDVDLSGHFVEDTRRAVKLRLDLDVPAGNTDAAVRRTAIGISGFHISSVVVVADLARDAGTRIAAGQFQEAASGVAAGLLFFVDRGIQGATIVLEYGD